MLFGISVTPLEQIFLHILYAENYMRDTSLFLRADQTCE